MTNPEDFLAPGGRLAARLAGWESRPEQVEMANLVAEAIAVRKHAIIEAGTGVGKSLAYLVPAVLAVTADQAEPVADEIEPDWDNEDEPTAAAPVGRPRRVVISTHTIALQEQLVTKDIPLVAAVMPREFSAVLVKGRRNYVSLRRLTLALERSGSLFSDEGGPSSSRSRRGPSTQPTARSPTCRPCPATPSGTRWPATPATVWAAPARPTSSATTTPPDVGWPTRRC